MYRLLATALKVIERSKEFTFFQTKVVGDSRSIATEAFCIDETIRRQLPEKQSASICRQILLSETPKRQSFRMKVV